MTDHTPLTTFLTKLATDSEYRRRFDESPTTAREMMTDAALTDEQTQAVLSRDVTAIHHHLLEEGWAGGAFVVPGRHGSEGMYFWTDGPGFMPGIMGTPIEFPPAATSWAQTTARARQGGRKPVRASRGTRRAAGKKAAARKAAKKVTTRKVPRTRKGAKKTSRGRKR